MRLRCSQEGSIPLALLVSIVTAGLIAVLVASVIQAERTVRFDRSFTNVIQSADAGVQDAYHRLQNNLLDIEIGDTLGPFEASLNGMDAEWTIERLTHREFEVVSEGVAEDGTSRSVIVEIEEDSLFFPGAFGDRLVALQGTSTQIDSYESRSTDTECAANSDPDRCWGTDEDFGTRKGALGTNNDFEFPGNVKVLRAILYDWLENPGQNTTEENPGGDRCDGNACTPDVLRFEDDPMEYGSDEQMQFIYDKLDDCDGREIPIDDGETLGSHQGNERIQLAPYSAADEHNEGSPAEPDWDNYYCATDLQIRAHLDLVNATPDKPVVIFVENSFLLNGHRHVNCPDCPTSNINQTDRWRSVRPEAGALQIYVGSDADQGGGEVTLSQHGVFAGVLYAPRARCGATGGSGGAGAHVYGSIICRTLDQVGNWRFHYDEQLADFGRQTYTIGSWREDAVGE
jgi:hypothetical protein